MHQSAANHNIQARYRNAVEGPGRFVPRNPNGVDADNIPGNKREMFYIVLPNLMACSCMFESFEGSSMLKFRSLAAFSFIIPES